MNDLTYKLTIRTSLSLILIGFISLSFLIGLYLGKVDIRYAPSNYLNESQIHVYNDSVCIDLENPHLTSYANSGSMRPTLDENSNGIRIPVTDKIKVNLGDIITYKNNGIFKSENDSQLIVHRVVGIRKVDDEEQYLMLGDNNKGISDGWINRSQIIYKTIGIIYTFFTLERFK